MFRYSLRHIHSYMGNVRSLLPRPSSRAQAHEFTEQAYNSLCSTRQQAHRHVLHTNAQMEYNKKNTVQTRLCSCEYNMTVPKTAQHHTRVSRRKRTSNPSLTRPSRAQHSLRFHGTYKKIPRSVLLSCRGTYLPRAHHGSKHGMMLH